MFGCLGTSHPEILCGVIRASHQVFPVFLLLSMHMAGSRLTWPLEVACDHDFHWSVASGPKPGRASTRFALRGPSAAPSKGPASPRQACRGAALPVAADAEREREVRLC